MKVILTREVSQLGSRDDVVNVADGYARNYLFPRNLAIPATPSALAEVERRAKLREAKSEKLLEQAKDAAERLAEVQLTIKGRVGSGTKLYGSITHADIAEALEQQVGLKVDKRKIILEEPIKSLGTYEVMIRLHKDSIAHIKVEVVGEQA